MSYEHCTQEITVSDKRSSKKRAYTVSLLAPKNNEPTRVTLFKMMGLDDNRIVDSYTKTYNLQGKTIKPIVQEMITEKWTHNLPADPIFKMDCEEEMEPF